MLDIIRQAAAGVLELPEEASQLVGQALSAIGDQLEEFAARLEALEQMVRGGGEDKAAG